MSGFFWCHSVDCIVPSTGERELELVKKIGINDSVPVVHENFRQWVVEDKFCAGRPNWEDVGVQFSSKVHQYEEQKIRILNAIGLDANTFNDNYIF